MTLFTIDQNVFVICLFFICMFIIFFFFFFNDTATTEIYTLSLHDALPISFRHQLTILSKTDALDEEKWLKMLGTFVKDWFRSEERSAGMPRPISYAVFCLKKKKETKYVIDCFYLMW